MVWLAAATVVINGFFPAAWILLTSLKTETELLKVPITVWPEDASLANYETAFTAQPILRFMWNSWSSRRCRPCCAFSLVRWRRTPSPGCASRIAT
jgi:ABC-type glycerol-3-phosphate transport system permease component